MEYNYLLLLRKCIQEVLGYDTEHMDRETLEKLMIDPVLRERERKKEIELEYSHVNKVVILFGSGMKDPYCKLSNFSEARIIVDGITYPSTEHAYQSLKVIESQRNRFSVYGDLGSENGFKLVFPLSESKKKQEYWMKKKNIGVIAKMSVNEERMKKLNLTMDKSFRSSDELWMKILLAKYSTEPFRTILLNTGSAYLLEFQRGAKRDEEKSSIWGGYIDDKGKLWGKNLMGIYLMKIRSSITMEIYLMKIRSTLSKNKSKKLNTQTVSLMDSPIYQRDL